MAELILTKEEERAALWKDLDNEAVGKICKVGLSVMDNADKERDFIQGYSAALMFVMKAVEANATTYTQTINGLTFKQKELGNWEITCKKIIKHCELCNDTGSYPGHDHNCDGSCHNCPVEVQCEECWTNPSSVFNQNR